MRRVDEMELSPRMATVLRAFLVDPAQPQFGFGLMESLKIASGTLYPILTRFRKVGWVIVETENIDPSVEGRPARRYYRLTPTGEVAAIRALNRMRALYTAPQRLTSPHLAGGEA